MQSSKLQLEPSDFWFFAFAMVAGSIFHFAYSQLGSSTLAGLIFPTNESTFQHLKLLALPAFLFFSVQWFFQRENSGFFLSRLLATIVGMIAIIVCFYTYTGVLGRNFLPLDILCFALGVASTILCYTLLDDSAIFFFPASNIIGFLGFAILLISLGVATAFPPKLGLFLDPQTGGYGGL